MVRLNRNELEKSQLDKLLGELSKTVSHLPSGNTDVFLSELLGNEERIMIAKRLAIVVLLLEKYSLYEIANILKVSPMTARSLKQKLNRGELDSVVKEISKNKKTYLSLLNTLDSVFHLGGILPHYGTHHKSN
jgi:Trp operon repressor